MSDPGPILREFSPQNGEVLDSFWSSDVDLGLEWKKVVEGVKFFDEEEWLMVECYFRSELEANAGFYRVDVGVITSPIGVVIL
jgi:hypothetical protein